MHESQLNLLVSNEKRICALEEQITLLKQRVKDLDDNYDKLYKFMLEKSEVIRRY